MNSKITRLAHAALRRLYSAAKIEDYWHRWATTPTSIDTVIYSDHWALVARSREQYANNDYVRRFVELCRTNIIGADGISVQSVVAGIAGQADTLAQSAIEQYFQKFSEAVDPARSMTRSDFEQLVIQSCAIDGEAFVMLRRSESLAFSLLDPAQCPIDYNDDSRYIRAGIRYTDAMMDIPVAYYFRTGKTLNGGYRSGDLMEIAASDCWHIYRREWVGQKRGLPWIATSLGRLRTLEGYENAALINARVGATKMGFFTRESGDAEYTGEQDETGRIVSEAEPGGFEILPDGYKLADWSPDYPNQQFGEFVNATLRGISVGLGVSHHSLTGDMSGVNYTSSRTALLDERDMWRRMQAWIIGQLTRRMFEASISYAVERGQITIGSAPLRRPIADYLAATYQGRRWAWVDPEKEVNAAEKAVALGIKSRSAVIRDNGQDPETVWAEIARERETMAGYGLDSRTPDQQAQPTPTQPQEPPIDAATPAA